MQLYLDESGDPGFSFSRPYRQGGSSRFLTIAFLLIPQNKREKPRRIVRKVYKKRGRPTSLELKGSDLKDHEKVFVAEKTVNLLTNNLDINLFSITVRKDKVYPHIQSDPNKLYNYMTKLALEGKLQNISHLEFIPDPRTIKVESGNSLVDYITMISWFEWSLKIKITKVDFESHRNLNLQFIDFIAHIVWSNFEDGHSEPYNILAPHIQSKKLYFNT